MNAADVQRSLADLAAYNDGLAAVDEYADEAAYHRGRAEGLRIAAQLLNCAPTQKFN